VTVGLAATAVVVLAGCGGSSGDAAASTPVVPLSSPPQSTPLSTPWSTPPAPPPGPSVGPPPTSRPTPSATTASPASAPCTAAALQAALDRDQPSTEQRRVAEQYCADGWAAAGVVLVAARAEVTNLFRSVDGRWTLVARTAACTAGEVPTSLYAKACQSN
jgi:hypothetical protein